MTTRHAKPDRELQAAADTLDQCDGGQLGDLGKRGQRAEQADRERSSAKQQREADQHDAAREGGGGARPCGILHKCVFGGSQLCAGQAAMRRAGSATHAPCPPLSGSAQRRISRLSQPR
jgi:hypothetical protein